MQGIQHLFRQHALEKETSMDSSWASAQAALANQAYLNHNYAGNSRPNDRTLSVDSSGDLKPSSWNQGKQNIQSIRKFKYIFYPFCRQSS